MAVGETPDVLPKRPPPTPKAIIHQKYGKQACYTIEEVLDSVQNGCPGLVFTQQGPCLYRCFLQLPEISVTSEPFKRKKDAEQAAAQLAIEKLGIHTTPSTPTVQEAYDGLVSRISYLFSDELCADEDQQELRYRVNLLEKFLLSLHPLAVHFREALQRECDLHGLVSVPILVACDSKLNCLCKYIDPKAELDILLTMKLIMRAAKLCSSVVTSEEYFWIWKQSPYTLETRQSLLDSHSSFKEDISVGAIYLPCSLEKPIEPVSLSILSNEYYLNVIAQKLGVIDTSHVLLSRTVGKSSSEMRIYFSDPHLSLELDPTSNLPHARETNQTIDPDVPLNARACYFSGQDIHGDAILAAVGYTWRSAELFSETISLGTFYRMLVGKLPDGGYKLSREAILAAELPLDFTNRSNWRGSFPKNLLSAFCHQNWLSEPEFSVVFIGDDSQQSETPETCKQLELSKPSENVYENGCGMADANGVGQKGTFRCEVKILSKNQDLIIKYSPQKSFTKQNDAIQNACLEVLSWFNKYFKEPNAPLQKWSSPGNIHRIHVCPRSFTKEFALCLSVHNAQQNTGHRRSDSLGLECMDQFSKQNATQSLNIKGPNSGVSPSNGSLACISYSITLKQEEEHISEQLESCKEFEFEMGTASVNSQLEACVSQMSTNQSACFISELPPRHLILAASQNHAEFLSLLDLQDSCLEYSVSLIRVTEPSEDRMEQALFSPPLSKQRVEYALRHINESGSTTLIDFGCGSGSLLESLMNYPSSLEKIVGVDISRKGLIHAAKVLHSKLTTSSEGLTSDTCIKSALLFDGSITVFDHRLYGFDIGTCLEVIEHMEEDQARLFGDIVLGSFRPKILIVSTPNYEYNPILQKTTQEGDKVEALSCKFRNHDHKFEWTRKQFNSWASDLALRYNYSVEFSGVGGCGDMEPGFASQIAVFRKVEVKGDEFVNNEEGKDEYELIWEWNSKA